jgi:hypothetical protein
MCEWFISNKRMTVGVSTKFDKKRMEHIIVSVSPIARAFIGQPLGNLEKWMKARAVEIE